MHASAGARKHFGLTGPSVVLDRRVNAVRGDIADLALAGTLFAPHYARPMERRCIVPSTAMRARADDGADLISELLHGEAFEVIDLSGGWAWGYSAHDHYVGYVRESALGIARSGGWRVAGRATALRDAPSPDAGTIGTLSMGAVVDGVASDGWLLTDEGAIALADLIAADVRLDPVEQAEKLLGVPYLMGGRSVEGIDCSGLVQIASSFAGVSAPRDSDQQAEGIGETLAKGSTLARGDLVFVPGHVAIMLDAERIIHANGNAMAVSIEPLAELIARLSEEDAAAMTVRRP
ncbi:NlpC/P60 family protein [Sphingomonas sp. LaA6.9]|uniref:C40 family peptidase n=1 Tax=Sphingomonas sp. LaA6.9 TaxID=2919914 RepID=UPI001F4FBF97|nr:NlpC/P60 family protein [Sphingomonas sp. LaA6.9]MCJ8159540.1 C40 family peptidase [Sphingomonas sp. LaA6.9]